jgi:hypothetical protein
MLDREFYIGYVVAAMLAMLMAYATFPAVQAFLVPDVPPLWEPVLSGTQAFSILGALTLLALLLSFINRFRQTKTTGEPFVPTIVWALLMLVVSVAATAAVGIFAFGFTATGLASLGVESAIAGVIGILVAILTMKVLSSR